MGVFTVVGQLIKKLLAFFFVAADGTVQKLKELYVVGEDGLIHKVWTDVVPWRAVKNRFYISSGSSGSCSFDKESVTVTNALTSTNGNYLDLYVYAPTGWTASTTNVNVELDIECSGSGTTNAYDVNRSKLSFRFSTSTVDFYANNTNGTTHSTGTVNSSWLSDNRFNVRIQPAKKASGYDYSTVTVRNMKIDGIPVEFYEA